MGAIDEISGDGKGAHLNGIHPNTPAERQKARITCASHALDTEDPHTELTQLLALLGLNPQKGEPR